MSVLLDGRGDVAAAGIFEEHPPITLPLGLSQYRWPTSKAGAGASGVEATLMTGARIIPTAQRGLNMLHADFSLKLFEPVATLSGAKALRLTGITVANRA